MKLKYLEMIVDAVFTLGERKGSSREAIWKYLQMKYPESVSQKKIFLAQMRRISAENAQIEKSGSNMQRFKLRSNFRQKYIKHLSKDEPMHLA